MEATAAPDDSSLAPDSAERHHLTRQLRLRDLVLAQVLTVVGSSWVGIAAGLGQAQFVTWLGAFLLFYTPMAVAVFYLNREMPLEGGLYVWARRAFGDSVGFMTAWNVWGYAVVVIALLLTQIPSELSFLIGPSAAGLPDNNAAIGLIFAVTLGSLAWASYRGLGVGKWIHNISGAVMMTVFALLIVTPLWAWLHHVPLHYAPFTFHLPHRDAVSLSLVSQVLFAASGLEYIAIMAGETHAAQRDIGRSVVIASPIIVLMFVLGTASVVSFHDLHSGTPINYIAPIPQTLSLAFGQTGVGSLLARLAIALLSLRILGAASFIFTGVVRLPMAAGWDHLVPAWFARLHPRFRTPRNSILFTTLLVAGFLLLSRLGTQAAEAFNLLNNSSSEFYCLAYLAMFLIPLVGAASLRKRLPGWVKWVCSLGVLATLFNLALNAYPFVGVANPWRFVMEIVVTTVAINALGYAFYRVRNKPHYAG